MSILPITPQAGFDTVRFTSAKTQSPGNTESNSRRFSAFSLKAFEEPTVVPKNYVRVLKQCLSQLHGRKNKWNHLD